MSEKNIRFTSAMNKDDDSVTIPTVYLDDGVVWREICPHELNAFFHFKDQIEMMNELAFSDLVSQAKDLQDAFNRCVQVLAVKK